jgi:hypothetical protein
MRIRTPFGGLSVAAALWACGCSCHKQCCRPACPPPAVVASPAPCCPPGPVPAAPAPAPPPGATQYYSGPGVVIPGNGH